MVKPHKRATELSGDDASRGSTEHLSGAVAEGTRVGEIAEILNDDPELAGLFLGQLTESASQTVGAAVQSHVEAGRPVYGQDRKGHIIKKTS